MAGWEKERELATTSLEFEFHHQFPCGSPSTASGLSDFRQSAQGGSERECKQTLTRHVPGVMTSLLMSYSPIIISHRLFSCRYSNSREVVESASSSRPAARAPRRACSHANRLQVLAPWTRVSNRFLGICDEFPYLKEAFKARSG